MEEAEFNCEERSGNGESINFLAQFPVPCLICGVDLEVDSIVKREVGDFDSVLTGEDNGALFNWFLKWFRVDLVGKGKQELNKRGGWDEGEGGDILKFCGICKGELIGILVLQRQLDELEEQIKNGLEAVKENMEKCEETFENTGVYERDQRYKRVRSRIVKCGNEKSRLRPPKNDRSSDNSGRKSTRNRAPVSRFNPQVPDHLLSPSEPVNFQERVIIPQEDNPNSDVDIKPEIPSDCESPPPSSSKTARKSTKKKKIAKPKKKLKEPTKSVETKPPKNSGRGIKAVKRKVPLPPPPSPPNSNNDSENYFLDTNFNDDSDSDDDKPSSSRTLRKMRKIHVEVDEDFTLDGGTDNSSSEDDNPDHNKDWSFRSEGYYKRYTYKLDPSKNTITVGTIPFTISSDQTKITCNTCSSAPSLKNDKDAMRRHVTKYHTDRFTCPHCPFRGEHSANLRTHIQSVHEGVSPKKKKRYPCKICGKPIRNRRNHEWSHMSQEEKDDATLKEPGSLPDWLRKRVQCEDCGKEFNGAWKLRKHREKDHEGIEKEAELCPECGGTFKNLEMHRKSQHGGKDGGKMEGRFKCSEEECGKRFTKMRMLTRHKNAVHWKLREWRCELCGREFGDEVRLKEHVNGHLGVRPWRCEGEGCGAAFNRKAHLQRHQRIYHEEGSRPKRKVFLRGPTVLGADFKKKELQKEGTYYPPSALRGWAKGRVPGHLMGKGEEME